MRTTYPVTPEQVLRPMEFHKNSLTVASCQNTRCGIKRKPMRGTPIQCPNCRHALFYERVAITKSPHWGKGGMNYDSTIRY